MAAQLEETPGARSEVELAAFHLVDLVYPDSPHRCQITDELRELDSMRFKAMRVCNEALLIIEALVVGCRILDAGDDLDTWYDRLDEATREPHAQAALKAALLKVDVFLQDGLSALIERIDTPATKRYHRRLLGAARYDRLAEAVADDLAAVLRALKRAIEFIKPLAVALQDAAQIISEKKIEQSGLSLLFSRPLLEMLTQLDAGLDHLLDVLADGRFDFKVDQPPEGASPDEVTELMTALREWLSEDLRVRVTKLNKVLERKYVGASEALAMSCDGPSQASNSLVELIDRLLRGVADKEQVLAWADAHYPVPLTKSSFVTTAGEVLPTKRTEALFLVYGGGHVDEIQPLNELVATAIAETRAQLQAVKHADEDLELARAQVEQGLGAVRGALSIALRLAGPLLTEEKTADIEDAVDR
ncbi:hypothetical protein [Glycomyces sp. NPDC047010]|uniref:hypothetical protein n=1 Tax=Glycomyces sp. NPDC047010 TaxID=3155023 RepID=UPI00340289B8